MAGAHFPNILQHTLRGWPPRGPNLFRWEHGRLLYADRRGGTLDLDVIAEAPPARWVEFWAACERIGVWAWPEWTGERGVNDGLQVDTELAHDGRHVRTRAQCYGAPDDFVASVREFHAALQWLVGWPEAPRPR